MNEKIKVGTFYKINREKLEEAIRAILDKLHSGFPEIVEKWAEERLGGGNKATKRRMPSKI